MKTPWEPWLFGVYRGWNPTQLYRDCRKPLKGSLLTIQGSMESRKVFVYVAQVVHFFCLGVAVAVVYKGWWAVQTLQYRKGCFVQKKRSHAYNGWHMTVSYLILNKIFPPPSTIWRGERFCAGSSGRLGGETTSGRCLVVLARRLFGGNSWTKWKSIWPKFLLVQGNTRI